LIVDGSDRLKIIMAHVMHALLLPSLAALAQAAVLFSGGTIVAFDRATEGLQVIRGGSLLVQDDRIVDLFDSPTPAGIPDDVEIVDTAGKIITPGFIDTHRHGWQTVFKTLGSNTTLVEYWGRFGEYAGEGHFTADDVYISQLMGIYEALNAGVTTMLDHAHHTWSDDTTEAGYRASIDSGARVVWCPSFHNVVNYTAADVINKFRDIAEKSEHDGTPTTIGIAYDGFGPSPNVEEVEQVMSLIEYVAPHDAPSPN
jgi:cytosine/adenosine deaminase-related metal-dependent hydrolase